MATQQQTEGQGAGFEASELQTLLNKEFKPRSDAAKEAVETAVRTLAEQQVAASAHCPFIAGVSPTVMQMESWQELANPRDLTKIFTTAEYAPWRSLRESE